MKKKCLKCNSKNDKNAKFCEKCGNEIEEVPSTESNLNTSQNSKRSIFSEVKETPKRVKAISGFIILLLIILSVTVPLLVSVQTRKNDEKSLRKDFVTLGEIKTQLKSKNEELKSAKDDLDDVNAKLEAQKKKVKPLPNIKNQTLVQGDYTVGQDLEAGVYTFTYHGGDYGGYIYVTYPNSKGTEETLGGTKFDYRVPGDKDGDQVKIKLDAGSKVHVDFVNGGSFDPGK